MVAICITTLSTKKNKRNVGNAEKNEYNCAGYALGIYSWYCPYRTEQDSNLLFDYGNEMNNKERLDFCIKVMLEDFPLLQIINKQEIHNYKDYEIIAFKVCNSDFHYMVKKGNRWFEKMGAFWFINRVPKKIVFADTWYGRYDSETIFFVNKARKLKKSA